MAYVTVGEAARELGCSPKLLSDWLYAGKLDNKRCPIWGGRRFIPRPYLLAIAAELQGRQAYEVA